jgi:hypothetical protein
MQVTGLTVAGSRHREAHKRVIIMIGVDKAFKVNCRFLPRGNVTGRFAMRRERMKKRKVAIAFPETMGLAGSINAG